MTDGRAVRKSPAETGEQRLVSRTLFACRVLKSHGIVPTITGCRVVRAGAGWTWTPELLREAGAWVGFVQGGSWDQLPDFWGLESPPQDFTASLWDVSSRLALWALAVELHTDEGREPSVDAMHSEFSFWSGCLRR